MHIELKKNILSGINNFLIEMKLHGKLSRARMKLVLSIEDALKELQEDIKQIQKDNEDDSDKKIYINQLLEEIAVIDITKHKRLINELYLFLDTYDVEMDGKEGFIHDTLLDAIEAAQIKNGDDE